MTMDGSLTRPGEPVVDHEIEAGEADYEAAVYGSLLVTSLMAVQWRYDASATFVGLSLFISVGVFWLTHCWSAIIDRRVRGPVDRSLVFAIGKTEAPMLTAAILPALILALGSLAILTIDQAIGLALLASIAQLFVWGIAVGRAAHSSWVVTLIIATVDCLLGIVIVVLKVLVIH